MEDIIYIKLDDTSLNRKLPNDMFNMVTTDNFKLYDEYVNSVITMDKDEKIAREIVK